MKIRVGFGFDVHQLVENRTFTLGGIEIQHTKGSLGHSDGDVLIHAICDALLGALKLRDIGSHFLDTLIEFNIIDSKILLKKSYDLVKAKGYEIVNIDSTISAQKPKLKPFIPEMETTMAEVL